MAILSCKNGVELELSEQLDLTKIDRDCISDIIQHLRTTNNPPRWIILPVQSLLPEEYIELFEVAKAKNIHIYGDLILRDLRSKEDSEHKRHGNFAIALGLLFKVIPPSVTKITIINRDQITLVCTALEKFLSAEHFISELGFAPHTLREDEYISLSRALTKQITGVKILNFDSNTASVESMRAIGNILLHHQSLLHLSLCRISNGGDGFNFLAQALENPLSQLQSLYMTVNRINDEKFSEIIPGIAKIQTLRVLNISENNIGDESIIKLAAGLKNNPNNQLEVLNLSSNRLIGTKGVIALATYLADPNCKLIDLDLSTIGDVKPDGIFALADALQKNRSLTTIKLPELPIFQEQPVANNEIELRAADQLANNFVRCKSKLLNAIRNNKRILSCNAVFSEEQNSNLRRSLAHHSAIDARVADHLSLVAPAVASLRANKNHELRYSIIPLLDVIKEMVRNPEAKNNKEQKQVNPPSSVPQSSKKATSLKVDPFISTRFFQDQLTMANPKTVLQSTPEIKDNDFQPPAPAAAQAPAAHPNALQSPRTLHI